LPEKGNFYFHGSLKMHRLENKLIQNKKGRLFMISSVSRFNSVPQNYNNSRQQVGFGNSVKVPTNAELQEFFENSLKRLNARLTELQLGTLTKTDDPKVLHQFEKNRDFEIEKVKLDIRLIEAQLQALEQKAQVTASAVKKYFA
jgi:hypothetical protein